jgi:hypothetical protein
MREGGQGAAPPGAAREGLQGGVHAGEKKGCAQGREGEEEEEGERGGEGSSPQGSKFW